MNAQIKVLLREKMIKIPHPGIKGVFICIYCRKILAKGIENKRGTCRTCYHKYHEKVKLTDYMNNEPKEQKTNDL